jgi:uncharacterized protein YkwD
MKKQILSVFTAVVMVVALAASAAATPLATTLPDRRLTDAERDEWVAAYRANGGMSEFELELARIINGIRVQNRLSPVEVDIPLMMAARFYTQTLTNFREFGHNVGPYRISGRNHGASENIANFFGGTLHYNGGNAASHSNPTPQAIVDMWMNSGGHRQFILSRSHTRIGVGRFGTNVYMFLSDTASNGCIVGGDACDFGEWSAPSDPTCTTDGGRSRRCRGCTNTEEDIVPAFGHTFGAWENTRRASFTLNGIDSRVCSVCEHVGTRQIRRLLLPYDPGDVNGDGFITVVDALAILRHLVGLESSVSPDNEDAWRAAQITPASRENNAPSISDALQVLRYVVWLPSVLDEISF